jgi:hypothetical protein
MIAKGFSLGGLAGFAIMTAPSQRAIRALKEAREISRAALTPGIHDCEVSG